MSLTSTPGTEPEEEVKLEVRVPGLDSEVNKAFPLEALRLNLWGIITESKLQKLARNVNGRLVYPTAVYIDNQIVNLLPDMTGSIRSDDPQNLVRSGKFFNGPTSEIDIESIAGVAAYKILQSPQVASHHATRASEAVN